MLAAECIFTFLRFRIAKALLAAEPTIGFRDPYELYLQYFNNSGYCPIILNLFLTPSRRTYSQVPTWNTFYAHDTPRLLGLANSLEQSASTADGRRRRDASIYITFRATTHGSSCTGHCRNLKGEQLRAWIFTNLQSLGFRHIHGLPGYTRVSDVSYARHLTLLAGCMIAVCLDPSPAYGQIWTEASILGVPAFGAILRICLNLHSYLVQGHDHDNCSFTSSNGRPIVFSPVPTC